MAEVVAYHFCGAGDMRGGVQDSTNTVAGYMAAEQGVKPHLFVGSTNNLERTYEVFDSFEQENVHVLGGSNHYITASGSTNPLGRPINPLKPYLYLREINPHVMEFNWPHIHYVGGWVLRAAELQNVPVVARYHIVSDEFMTNAAQTVTGRIDRNPIQQVDAMIAVSPPALEHAEQVYGYKGDIHVIPNGVDVERYAQSKPFEADEPFEGFDPSNPTIVFVGRPDPRKGLGSLLHTFELVKRKVPEAQLIVCGSNDEDITKDKQLQEYIGIARHLGISDKTHFMGRVSEKDKGRWLASANVATFPSRANESQGIVLLEAMAAGSGVVLGGNNSGYTSVLSELPDGKFMLVDPSIISEFSERIVHVIQNDAIAAEMHATQQALVRNKYDIRVVGQQIHDVYQQVQGTHTKAKNNPWLQKLAAVIDKY